MPRLRLSLIVVLIAVGGAVAASPTSAALFAGDPIVGPSLDVERLGDLDLARDGSGALVFISREGGLPRAFVSRFVNGAFVGAERVDTGLELGVTDAVIAASPGGRIVAVFVAGPTVYAALRPNGASPWGAPVPLSPGTDPSVAMSLTGTAYASFTNAGDVGLSRLDRTTNAWSSVAGPMDVDVSRSAGTGPLRSRVAISADGVGIVVWGEAGADGGSHVYARKVFGTRASDRPQDLTLNELGGQPAQGADTPEVDAEDDSSFAWVVFRQTVTEANGQSRVRVVARRQRGTEFDPAVVVDSQGVPASEDVEMPRIDLNGRGEGIATSTGTSSHQPIAALLQGDAFAGGQRYGTIGGVPASAVAAVSDNSDALLAWVHSPGAEPGSVRGRALEKFAAGPETSLSKPEFGSVDPALGVYAAADRAGSGIVAWVQSSLTTPGARSIVAGYLDRPPRAFAGRTGQNFRKVARPTLQWGESVDLWGPPTYRVVVDGVPLADVLGQTSFQPGTPLDDGVHRWSVEAIDRRGQSVRTRTRLLRIDTTAPELSFRLAGSRKAGAAIKLSFAAADVANPQGASGLSRVRIAWGDGTTTTTTRSRGTLAHRFRRGRYVIRVSATDRAGASTVLERNLRIAKR